MNDEIFLIISYKLQASCSSFDK